MKKRQRLVNQVNGIDDYDNPLYQPLQDTEYNAELYYGVHVTDWLTVRPNLQYIKQPGGVDEVDNALVAGIKIRRCSDRRVACSGVCLGPPERFGRAVFPATALPGCLLQTDYAFPVPIIWGLREM